MIKITRKIITIDEDLCNGCGHCTTGCSEGALQIVNGKAKLLREDFCDGFGDCIGACPTGALKIEERESNPFDEIATKAHLLQTGGAEAVARMEEAQKQHSGGGCPGSRAMQFNRASTSTNTSASAAAPAQSELNQWPIQLHLVHPSAPFFKNRELVVMSTCAPLASADVHSRFLKGRSVVVACPKLDKSEPYVEKLASIMSEPTIPKVIIVRMEVPCCGGLSTIASEARKLCPRKDIIIEEQIVAIESGSIRSIKLL
ncbi:MAG: 4Fe-4S ferredoxin [Oligoflexia bacterium]|nr:4Fe-4S ferredoxin [Oligoflexia bacterium]MBF0365804.1 4Fe-4S ferredoxin [Oligoflexia bacterium]